MKKILSLFVCLFVLNACDDGDMAFDSFDFSEVTSSSCTNNNLIFKVNANEALLLQINDATDRFPFRNEIGATPRVYNINTNNKVIYRTYNGNVTNTYFCATIPPVSPTVSTEWITSDSSGGTIEITTSMVPSTTSASTAKYQHSIIFKNITLVNSDGATMTYETLNFGVYQTNSNVKFAFGNTVPQRCAGTDTFFKVFDTNIGNELTRENINEVLELKIPTTLFPTVINGSEKIFLNQSQGVTATYRIYDGDVLAQNYCAATGLPTLFEEWTAEDGLNETLDEDDTGFITITSGPTLVNGQLTYTITYKDFTFIRVAPQPTDPLLTSKFTSELHNFGSITF